LRTDGYEPDKLGEWSERKIAIVSKYTAAYSNILAGHRLKHFYRHPAVAN
jgi:hypothetical protein